MKYVLALAVLILSACAGGGPLTPQRTFFQAEQAYVIAAKGANIYIAYPRCSTTQAAPCSDPAIVVKIKAADAIAYAALKDAEAIVRQPAASTSSLQVALALAQGTVSTLTNALTSLGVLK